MRRKKLSKKIRRKIARALRRYWRSVRYISARYSVFVRRARKLRKRSHIKKVSIKTLLRARRRRVRRIPRVRGDKLRRKIEEKTHIVPQEKTVELPETVSQEKTFIELIDEIPFAKNVDINVKGFRGGDIAMMGHKLDQKFIREGDTGRYWRIEHLFVVEYEFSPRGEIVGVQITDK